MSARRFRRGIYLLPTLFTVGNLYCGFSSLVQSAWGSFEQAAVLVILAGVLDTLDGRIARLTGTTSEFGIEFDSLADLVSFGVAPAFLAYQWVLAPLHRLGWLVAFLFVVCAAMRLARFNIQTSPGNKRYFAGLPTPPAALAVACMAFAIPDPPDTRWAAGLVAVLLIGIAILMVSRLRYRSFKDIDLRSRRSSLYVLFVALAIGAIAYDPAGASIVLASAYVISGPASYVVGLVRRLGTAGPKTAERTPVSEVANEPIAR